MVHIKKCPNPNGRDKPSTEFYIDGKPQIYCYGWKDAMTDEPLPECKKCKDWVYGEQCEKDFQNARKRGKVNEFGFKRSIKSNSKERGNDNG